MHKETRDIIESLPRSPGDKESLSIRLSKSDEELNDYLLYKKDNNKGRDFNRLIGFLGEYEAEVFFLRKGFHVDKDWPIDINLTKDGLNCQVDVKATSQDKWIPLKYFHNKERQLSFFGFSIDEYLRVKILLDPYRAIFNEDDLKKILEYFH